MPQQIELTDMLSGITETYATPLWQFIELIAQRRGSLVILRDTNGRRHTIPL